MRRQADLFSAVVTGFAIGSCKWLQEDPTTKTAELLSLIASRTGSNSSDSAFDSSTTASSALLFRVSSAVIYINMLWFSSLTLSLMTALFGILA
jgi:hypothetical protein